MLPKAVITSTGSPGCPATMRSQRVSPSMPGVSLVVENNRTAAGCVGVGDDATSTPMVRAVMSRVCNPSAVRSKTRK